MKPCEDRHYKSAECWNWMPGQVFLQFFRWRSCMNKIQFSKLFFEQLFEIDQKCLSSTTALTSTRKGLNVQKTGPEWEVFKSFSYIKQQDRIVDTWFQVAVLHSKGLCKSREVKALKIYSCKSIYCEKFEWFIVFGNLGDTNRETEYAYTVWAIRHESHFIRLSCVKY